MRKTCAQAVVSVFTFLGSKHTIRVFNKFILNLYRRACTTFRALNTFFAHMSDSLFSVVDASFSTNSTGLITITTFYKKDLLTTHRGIN